MGPSIHLSDSIGRLLPEAGSSIAGSGEDVFTCLRNLTARYPAIHPYIFDDKGQLTPFINIYLNGIDVRFSKNSQLTVTAADKIEIIPSLSGG
jgi:molybdopterin converting factor small subunit